jgi:hypothetical protein
MNWAPSSPARMRDCSPRYRSSTAPKTGLAARVGRGAEIGGRNEREDKVVAVTQRGYSCVLATAIRRGLPLAVERFSRARSATIEADGPGLDERERVLSPPMRASMKRTIAPQSNVQCRATGDRAPLRAIVYLARLLSRHRKPPKVINE